MRCLYIDTSSSYLYSAIVENDSIVASVNKEYGQLLSEKALPEIVGMFENNNLTAKDIDKIIVVNGPGSFTGIRIGITIAKVYAWSLKTPITTITSLDAMAVSNKDNKYKVPVIDARRGYVFTAIYDENNNVVLKPSYITIEELNKHLENINNYAIITNDKKIPYEETLNYEPDFIEIINKYKDKDNINPHAVNPDYLKMTEAEERKNISD